MKKEDRGEPRNTLTLGAVRTKAGTFSQAGAKHAFGWLFCPCPQEGAYGSHMEGTSGHSVTVVHQAFFTKSSEMEDLSHVQMNF